MYTSNVVIYYIMKMLPHCHPVEVQLLAFPTEDHTSNLLELQKKKKKPTIKKIYKGLLLFIFNQTPHLKKKKSLFDLRQAAICSTEPKQTPFYS